MDREWNDSQPIYRQLRDRVVAMILDGILKEGDPLPSVRQVQGWVLCTLGAIMASWTILRTTARGGRSALMVGGPPFPRSRGCAGVRERQRAISLQRKR